MKQRVKKGLIFFMAIAMVLALIPAGVFGADGEKVLTGVKYNLGDDWGTITAVVNNNAKTIEFTVPYGYPNKSLTFPGGFTPTWDTKYIGPSTDFAVNSIEIDKASVDLTVDYYVADDSTKYSTVYAVSVKRADYVGPQYSGNITVSGNSLATSIPIPATYFTDNYSQKDGEEIYKIVITNDNPQNNITLYVDGTVYSKDSNIFFSDIKAGKLTAKATVAGTGNFYFNIYHDKADPKLVATNKLLSVTVTNQTALSDITKSIGKTATYTSFSADILSKTGKALSAMSSLKITSGQPSNGTLYKNYTSTSNPGTQVMKEEIFNYSSATNDVTKLCFVPSGTGTATISYVATDSTGYEYTGSIKITVSSSGSSTVTITVDQDDTVALSRTDFNTACNNYFETSGTNLSYIMFDSSSCIPSTSYGNLYYNYKSSSSTGTRITAGNTQYNYSTSGSKPISDITFVPKSGYNGTFSTSFTGCNTSGTKFTGTIKFTVEGSSGDIATISYSASKGGKVTFKANDFTTKYKAVDGNALKYVEFDSLPTTNGSWYYDYVSSSDTGTKASASTICYASSSDSSKNINKLTFVPKSTYTGTFYIDYTGYSSSNKNALSGRIKITVGSGSSSTDIAEISYTIAQDKTQTLSATTMNTKFKDASDDAALYYATFEQPSSSSSSSSSPGTLYYDYVSSSNKGSTVSESTKYYRTSSGSRKLINNITFVPKSGYNGTVYIDYVGYDEDDNEYTGQIKIKVGSGSSSDDDDADIKTLTYSIKSTETLTALANSINTAFKNVDGSNLDYVTFTLPSSTAGTLYTTYSESTKTGTTSSSNTKYYRTGTPALNSVVFVPNAGYSGTVDLKYRAYNEDGDYSDGIIRITVSAGSVSKYFNDVPSDYHWAATEIDSLYSRDIVKGTTSTAYSPKANIKRGDFMLMLYRAFDLESKVTVTDFKDVSKSSYYYDAIMTGKALGIAEGSGGNFKPEANLTREDAMALVYRTMDVVGKNLTAGTSSDLTQFSDRSLISAYAYTPVATLVKSGIIKGTTDSNGNYKVNPKSNLTRAEMAVVLYRVLDL